MIGAVALSEMAKELEDAGKRKDREFIKGRTEKLLEMYRGFYDKLMWLEEEDENLPEISKESLEDAYQTLQEIAGSMDYDLVDSILKQLRGYHLPPGHKEKVERIEDKLSQLDWEGIVEEAKKDI